MSTPYLYRGLSNTTMMINYIIDHFPERVTLAKPMSFRAIEEAQRKPVLNHKFISPLIDVLLENYGTIALQGNTIHLRVAEPELFVTCFADYDFERSIGLVFPFARDQYGRIVFQDNCTQNKGVEALFVVSIDHEKGRPNAIPEYIAQSIYHFLAHQFDIWHVFDDLQMQDVFRDHPRHTP